MQDTTPVVWNVNLSSAHCSKTSKAVANPLGGQNSAFLSTRIVEDTTFTVITAVLENRSFKMESLGPTLAS